MKIESLKEYDQAYKLWNETGIRIGQLDSQQELGYIRHFETNKHFFPSIYLNNDLIATCVMFCDGRKGSIYRLAVIESKRKQGLAKKLIQRCEEIFRDKEIYTSYCLIEESNAPSIDLLSKSGYENYNSVKYFVKRLKSKLPKSTESHFNVVKSIDSEKMLTKIKIHNQFQSDMRNIQLKFSNKVNDINYIPSDEEKRAIQLYWYLVFDEWMTCKHLNNDFLNDLWDNYYCSGAKRALNLVSFRNSLEKMIEGGTSFLGLKDEFLSTFYYEE